MDAAAEPQLAAVLISNRIAPLCARAAHLRGVSGGSLLASIERAARDVATRSLAGLVTLRSVASTLDAAGVPWMLWKGPALAMQAWDDPAAREFSDLDLVVPPAFRARARAALLAAGWHARHGMSAAQERAILSGSGALEYARSAHEPVIELHWRFASPRFPTPLATEMVLGRAERMTIGGTTVLTPSGADALVLLAQHATKHGWSQAEEVLTFARLAQRSTSALAIAVGDVRRAGMPTPLGLALNLARRLAGLALSPAATLLADSPRVVTLVEGCMARMCAGDGGWRPDHAWSLAWMDRATDRARYRARALLSPTLEEWRWVRLPDLLAPAYPAVRLLRLGVRSLRR